MKQQKSKTKSTQDIPLEDYLYFNTKEDEREALQELSENLYEFTAEQSYRFE